MFKNLVVFDLFLTFTQVIFQIKMSFLYPIKRDGLGKHVVELFFGLK